jgi:hypothetical protein
LARPRSSSGSSERAAPAVLAPTAGGLSIVSARLETQGSRPFSFVRDDLKPRHARGFLLLSVYRQAPNQARDFGTPLSRRPNPHALGGVLVGCARAAPTDRGRLSSLVYRRAPNQAASAALVSWSRSLRMRSLRPHGWARRRARCYPNCYPTARYEARRGSTGTRLQGHLCPKMLIIWHAPGRAGTASRGLRHRQRAIEIEKRQRRRPRSQGGGDGAGRRPSGSAVHPIISFPRGFRARTRWPNARRGARPTFAVRPSITSALVAGWAALCPRIWTAV